MEESKELTKEMEEEEKTSLVLNDNEVRQIMIDDREYEIVVGRFEKEGKCFLVAVYDFAVENNVSYKVSFETLFNYVLDSIRDEVSYSCLSRSSKYRLLKRPVWEIQEAMQNIKPRGSRHVCDVPLRLLNSPSANQRFQGDFRGLVILSALCSLYERGYKVITYSDLWKVIHQSARWNSERDKQGFISDMTGVVNALDRMETSQTTMICASPDEDRITMAFRPQVWTDARKQIILINKGYLQVRCQLNVLHRIYIARRIELSRRFENMKPLINLNTMQKETGLPIERNKIEGYMGKLVEDKRIKLFKLDGGLYWENVQKTDSDAKSDDDHSDIGEGN